jgi:hypothetical protein
MCIGAWRVNSRQQQHEVPLRGLYGCVGRGGIQSAQADFALSLQRLQSPGWALMHPGSV